MVSVQDGEEGRQSLDRMGKRAGDLWPGWGGGRQSLALEVARLLNLKSFAM